ncbi:MAG: hypothetical protein SFZ03_08065 [Candidatus Melainabacteria bacterium]|nr:hypothetical protein [Candidatus Melainabacteria bacterium]
MGGFQPTSYSSSGGSFMGPSPFDLQQRQHTGQSGLGVGASAQAQATLERQEMEKKLEALAQFRSQQNADGGNNAPIGQNGGWQSLDISS